MILRIAWRNLTRQRRRTSLVLLALALGFAAVTGVRGFLNGLQRELVSGFAEGQVGALVVRRAGFTQSNDVAPLTPAIDLRTDVRARIEATPGVFGAAPRLVFPGLVSVGDRSTFALIVGVEPEAEARVAKKRFGLVRDGHWLRNDNDTIIGRELLDGLIVDGRNTGVLTVLANDKDGVMNAAEGPIVATIAAATQGEKRLALLSLPASQALLRMPNEATEIAVGVVDLTKVDAIKVALQKTLGTEYEVRTWKDVAPFAADVVATQDAALNIIVAIFLSVILLGLMNAMLQSVMERVREIGTMLSLGARRHLVVRMFVAEAAFVGFIGSALGALLGTLVMWLLAQRGVRLTTPGASEAQLLFPFVHGVFLLKMVGLGGASAILASLYPALRASKLDPVTALAHT